MASDSVLQWIPGSRMGAVDGALRGELRHADDDPALSEVFRWLAPVWNTLDDNEADPVPPAYRRWARQVVMAEPGFDGTAPPDVLRGFERDAIELRFRAGRDAYLHLPGNELARRDDAFYLQRLLQCAAGLLLPWAPRPLGDDTTRFTLSRIERDVDAAAREKLRAAIGRLVELRGKEVLLGDTRAAIAAWQLGVHCSAHRVGLVLAGDLEIAMALAGRRRHGTHVSRSRRARIFNGSPTARPSPGSPLTSGSRRRSAARHQPRRSPRSMALSPLRSASSRLVRPRPSS